MSSPASEPRPLLAWLHVLGQIEQALHQALALHAEPAPAPPHAGREARPAPLQVLDDRLARWQACLDQGERNAAEAEALLATEARALEDWSRALAAAGEKLAKAVGPG
jgi:hypothetical protein